MNLVLSRPRFLFVHFGSIFLVAFLSLKLSGSMKFPFNAGGF